MSLLATVDAGNASLTQSYFIKDLSTDGLTPKVGTNAAGTLTIQSNPVGSVVTIRPDLASAGNMRLGASAGSFQNIALSDGLTTVNTVLAMGPAGTPSAINAGAVNVDGDLTFVNGASGDSISGYYSANVAVVGAGAVPNPAGLTNGVYLAVYIGNGAGNENAQPSGVFYYTTVGGWSGNAVSFNFTAGAPNVALGPVAGGATLNIGGASVPATGTVYIRKLMN